MTQEVAEVEEEGEEELKKKNGYMKHESGKNVSTCV